MRSGSQGLVLWAALPLLLAATGCGTTVVARRAAPDLRCPAERISVGEAPGELYRAEGCQRKAYYFRTYELRNGEAEAVYRLVAPVAASACPGPHGCEAASSEIDTVKQTVASTWSCEAGAVETATWRGDLLCAAGCGQGARFIWTCGDGGCRWQQIATSPTKHPGGYVRSCMMGRPQSPLYQRVTGTR